MIVRNGHEFDTIKSSVRTNLVDHLLNGVVVAGALRDHPLGFMTIELNSEMERTARVPLMKKGPDIMLCSFFEFIKFKL